MLKKKLMILGAGLGQLSAIKKAVEFGYHVITVDYLPDNVGHHFSHQYVNCSTTNIQGVLEAAKKNNIDGILTVASDVAAPTVAYVSDVLNLPGPDYAVLQEMTQKHRFRSFQNKHCLNCPSFAAANEFDKSLEDQLKKLELPIVFKPIDTSGSRGVNIITYWDIANIQDAFNTAQHFSRSGTVCIENYISGIEVGGDAFFFEENLIFLCITKKYKNKFIVTGHKIPTEINVKDIQKIRNEIIRTCRLLGYHTGPLNFDIFVNEDEVIVLEMSPRCGGNGIPGVIEQATGVDLIKATIDYSLDLPINLSPVKSPVSPTGSYIIFSCHGGILQQISSFKKLSAEVPEIFDYQLNCKVGDEVSKFSHGGDSLGCILFNIPDGSSYEEISCKIDKHLDLNVL